MSPGSGPLNRRHALSPDTVKRARLKSLCEKGIPVVGGAPVHASPLLARLSPDSCVEITSAGRSKEFARDQIVHNQGSSAQHVLLLTAGVMKITQLGLGGSEVILRLGVPGDVIGATDLFSSGSTYSSTAQAFRSCSAIVWDASVFRAMTDRFPVMHRNMVHILRGDLIELQERFRELATERVGLRVARQLVRLLLRIGREKDGAVEIGVSREEVAQMTGTTMFTVSRLLSAWEERGIVRLGRETVLICDLPALRDIEQENIEDGDRVP